MVENFLFKDLADNKHFAKKSPLAQLEQLTELSVLKTVDIRVEIIQILKTMFTAF